MILLKYLLNDILGHEPEWINEAILVKAWNVLKKYSQKDKDREEDFQYLNKEN